jgi:hypothetical protein
MKRIGAEAHHRCAMPPCAMATHRPEVRRVQPVMIAELRVLACVAALRHVTYLVAGGFSVFDEGFVTLSKPREMAFHSGFTGQRGERTWRGRIKILADLGFIDVRPGASGPMSYALIYNPYLVIRRLHEQRHPGLRDDKYNALIERAGEVNATDFGLPDPWAEPAPVAESAH